MNRTERESLEVCLQCKFVDLKLFYSELFLVGFEGSRKRTFSDLLQNNKPIYSHLGQ